MIYLDTHVVVWFYVGLTEKFSAPVRQLINENDLYISPMVRLELRYLYEIQRITEDAETIVDDLSQRIGLQICGKFFDAVVTRALTCSWTRDPFDRLIVAHAAVHDNVLLSKDQTILENYPHARW